jgi:aspartyl-tRNA(Asn)/glutamyl-tRNA(Gln) amidotransferase subunit C
MISKEDIKNLARLARIGVDEQEIEKLQHDLGAILGYVGELDKLSLGELKSAPGAHKNILREDGMPHDSGQFTEALLHAAAESKNGTIVVRQIIEK